MVTADELLARVGGVDNRVCTIDLDTRKINIPSSITTLGVESDDGVKRLYFQMPRTYRETDLSNSFSIRINYMNANDDPPSFSPALGVTVSEDTINFYWKIERDVVAYKGDVKFNVCLKHSDNEGTVTQELNTTVATLPVLEGLEPDMESIQVEPIDYLAQLMAVKDEYVSDISSEGEGYLQRMGETHAELEKQLQDTAKTISNNFGPSLRTRANAIVQTSEGEIITVDDSSDDYLRGLRIFGRSRQPVTTGKNLFSTTLEQGLWVFSTKTKMVNTSYVKSAELVRVIPGETYTFSGYAVKNFQGNLAFYDENGVYTGDDKQIFAFNTFVVPDGVHFIAFHMGTSFVNNINGEVQLEKGSVSTEYEPYSGGFVSPSPDWAQPVQSVENPAVNIHRKNLVRTGYSKTDTYEGMTVTITKGKSDVTLNGTTTKPYGYAISQGTYLTPGRYTMSVYGLNASDKAYLMNIDTRIQVCDNVRTGSPVTFDVTAAGIYRIDFTFAKETTYSNTTVSFQIEAGEIATEYEPIVPFETLTLNRTLRGIPVTSGGNYTDQNGQQWVCDEIDFERGVYVQRIGEAEYVGSDSEPWLYNTGVGLQKDPVFLLTLSKLNTTRKSTDRAIICNSYAVADKLPIQNNEYWKVDTYFGIKQVAFRNDDFTDLSGWKAHLKDKPIRLTYELATPIETPLTAAELAAYSALHSNYPNTTVLNDAGANMELKYNADTATFFIRSRASAELIQAAVNYYLDKSGVQVPSDEHIKNMATTAVKDTVVPNDDELDDLLAAIQ